MSSSPLYPKRPQSHVVGDSAVDIFRSACPKEWVVHPIRQDYGLDLRVELTTEGQLTGEEFFVQVKGRGSVIPGADGFARIRVAPTTVNYWLGKLHPTMVVLADVNRKRFWFDWLEYAYRDYPRIVSSEQDCTLVLSAKNTSTNFERIVSTYVRSHFQSLRADAAKLFVSTQLSKVLLHTSYLYRCCTRMALTLQGEPMTEKERIQDLFYSFYLEFGLHDEFLTGIWEEFTQSRNDSSSQIRNLLASRLCEYASLRNTFFMREHRVAAGDFYFVPVNYSAVVKNLLPMSHILSDLEEILQVLVLGRTVFPHGKKMTDMPNTTT